MKRTFIGTFALAFALSGISGWPRQDRTSNGNTTGTSAPRGGDSGGSSSSRRWLQRLERRLERFQFRRRRWDGGSRVARRLAGRRLGSAARRADEQRSRGGSQVGSGEAVSRGGSGSGSSGGSDRAGLPSGSGDATRAPFRPTAVPRRPPGDRHRRRARSGPRR